MNPKPGSPTCGEVPWASLANGGQGGFPLYSWAGGGRFRRALRSETRWARSVPKGFAEFAIFAELFVEPHEAVPTGYVASDDEPHVVAAGAVDQVGKARAVQAIDSVRCELLLFRAEDRFAQEPQCIAAGPRVLRATKASTGGPR